MKFFRRLPLALSWKKRVFVSPSRMMEILVDCFLRAFSMISQLIILEYRVYISTGKY
jgi:hypothetical protein